MSQILGAMSAHSLSYASEERRRSCPGAGLQKPNYIAVAALLMFAVDAAAAPAPNKKKNADRAEVAETTAAAKTPADLYLGLRYRNPFVALRGRGGGAARDNAAGFERIKFNLEDFNIHQVDLKGFMKDKGFVYALLVEPESGTGFIVRKRKVFDYKNNSVPGVTGTINLAQKTVILQASDGDVQTLTLGEEEEDEEDYDEEDE